MGPVTANGDNNGVAGAEDKQAMPAIAAPTALPRPQTKDPEIWAKAFEKPEQQTGKGAQQAFGPITDKDLLDSVFMYGDLCEITYSNYVRTGGDLAELQGTLTPAQKARRVDSPMGQPKVGGFKYLPSEVMGLKAGNEKTGPDGKADPLRAEQINVAEDSPARKYTIGVKYNGKVEDDLSFYLVATAGFYEGEIIDANLLSTNWIGFIGIGPPVAGKRDIVIAFRGTQAWTEWLSNAAGVFKMVSWYGEDMVHAGGMDVFEAGGGAAGTKTATVGVGVVAPRTRGVVRVAQGFEQMYRRFNMTPGNTLSTQGQVHVAVRKLLACYGDEVGSITTTGHSLGGALASICAFDLVQSGINHQGDHPLGLLVPVTAVTFEAPRVGNHAFADAFDPEFTPDGPRCLRIVNVPDVVPKVPYVAAGSNWLLPLVVLLVKAPPIRRIFGRAAGLEVRGKNAYIHGGTEYRVDDRDLISPEPNPALGLLDRALARATRWLPSIADISKWHDFQLVLCKMDAASAQKTRGRLGPLQVPGNEKGDKSNGVDSS